MEETFYRVHGWELTECDLFTASTVDQDGRLSGNLSVAHGLCGSTVPPRSV